MKTIIVILLLLFVFINGIHLKFESSLSKIENELRNIQKTLSNFNAINKDLKQLNNSLSLFNQSHSALNKNSQKYPSICYVNETTAINEVLYNEREKFFSFVKSNRSICALCLNKEEKIKILKEKLTKMNSTYSSNISMITEKVQKINSIQGEFSRYNNSMYLYIYYNCTDDFKKEKIEKDLSEIARGISLMVEMIQKEMRKDNIDSNFIILKSK